MTTMNARQRVKMDETGYTENPLICCDVPLAEPDDIRAQHQAISVSPRAYEVLLLYCL